MPSSSRACAPDASFAISCAATLRGKVQIDTTLDVDLGQLVAFEFDILTQLLALPCKIGVLGVDCELTDTYSLAAIASHQRRVPPYQQRGCRRGWVRGRDAHDQARRRDNPFIGSEHGGGEPSNAVDR